MPQFSSFLQEFGVGANTPTQLSTHGINDLDQLSTTTKEEAAKIVDDPVLATILPVLNENYYMIFNAPDKYAKAREILQPWMPSGKAGAVSSNSDAFVQSGPGVETSYNTVRNGRQTLSRELQNVTINNTEELNRVGRASPISFYHPGPRD